MGSRVDHFGQEVAAATSKTLYYRHPVEKGTLPSKIGSIAAGISAGTKTGKVSIYAGWEASGRVLGHSPLTAIEPDVIVNPEIVLMPGQVIRAEFENITVGDTCFLAVEGH